MNYLRERVAYLKGLAEGMQISDTTNEGKLLKAIIEVLDDFALAVDDMEEVQEQLSDQIESIDEDLAEIEKIVYEDYDEYEEDEEEESNYLGEFECPHCGEKVEIYEDMLDEDTEVITCPKCGKDIEVEWECECEECEEKSKE